MELHPKLRREVCLMADADDLSHQLVSTLRKHHVTVQQFFPAVRVIGSVLRPLSFSLGQEIRVDFRPTGEGRVDAIIESRFNFPAIDFTHENQKNVDMVEELLRELAPACPARQPAAASAH